MVASPHLARSSLHRLFQRHDISRLPEVESSKPKIGIGSTNEPVKRLSSGTFKAYPIEFFYLKRMIAIMGVKPLITAIQF